MPTIIDIINEEIMTTVANYPLFGDHLRSISETGEGSAKSYQFKYDNVAFNQVEYHFATEDHDDYIVSFHLIDAQNGEWYMQFGIVGGTPDDVINKGKLYKVMSTILKIVNDFIERHQPNTLKFEPSKDNERDDDNRRFNLYMQFIKKNMQKNYYVEPRGDWIFIRRKIPIKYRNTNYLG